MAAGAFVMEGFDEQVKMLRRMMTDDPLFRRRVNGVIKQVLTEARKMVSEDVAGILTNDPRNAYKAVRSAVYKRILGGQVNILQKRKAGQPTSYQKPRKGLPKRGGNRWGRSQRTANLEGYEGADRGFVLRFINAGTQDRSIRSYTDKNGDLHDLITMKKGGNRGNIKARGFFGASSQKALEQAAENMQKLIDKLIEKEFV